MLHLLLSRHHISGLAVTLVLAVSSALPAIAKDAHPHVETQGVFSEVIQDLQDAIINRGFVVDFVGHVDTMLNRTSDASKSVTETGSRSPFLNAKYVQFCSAKLTHEAVSANPYNVVICPHVFFAFEDKAKPGRIIVGYRRPAPGPSKRSKKAFAKVDDLMMEIVKEVTGK
jgi:hypothetical protein